MTQINIPDGLEADSTEVAISAAFVREIVTSGIGSWITPLRDRPEQPAIVLGAIPPSPTNIIGITPYVVSMDVAAGVDTHAVQIRTRTAGVDPRPNLILVDKLEELLHGRGPFPIRDNWISPMVWRHSVAVLGESDAGNFEITSNYYLYIENRNTQEAYYG